MTTDWQKQTSASKLIAGALLVTGIVMIVKNHKRDGFWTGLGAGFILFGLSVKIYK
jgi:hypothetical protein